MTITGIEACFLHHSAVILTYSGTCPTADPIPLSDMPCGQPKLSSKASAPVSSIIGTYLAQDASFIGSITEATNVRSGQSRLICFISFKLVCSGRSVISSILLNPITWRSLPCSTAYLGPLTLTICGSSPSVFQTTPPQPASKARLTL